MNLDDLPLDEKQRARLAALGVVDATQLQGMLAVPAVAAHLGAALGLDATELTRLGDRLAAAGLDPQAVPPEPPRRSGVDLPRDDKATEVWEEEP